MESHSDEVTCICPSGPRTNKSQQKMKNIHFLMSGRGNSVCKGPEGGKNLGLF